jgi:hypothetical protein
MTGDADVLSYGPPERRRSWKLPVLVVGAVIVGYLLGSRETAPVGAASDAPDPVEALVAGVVRETFPIGDDLAFDIVLHNGSGEALEVTVESVGPFDVRQPERPAQVPAHSSRTVAVTVPTTCSEEPSALTRLTAEVGTGAAARRVDLSVLDAGDLAAYLTALCAEPTAGYGVAVEGVWTLERAFARWNRSEGSLLLWFRPDGTFVADDQGRLFTREASTSGDYRVRGARLRMVFRTGFVCAPGDSTTWELHRRTATALSLRYVSGGCPREPGGVWVLERVLSSVPGGVEW